MISNILASTRNLVRFSFLKPNIGDNALATIKDLNQVIKSINTQMYYRPYHLFYTQSGANDPVQTTVMVGSDSDCNSNCTTAADDCACPNFLTEKSGALIVQSKRTAVGVYELLLNSTNTDVTNNRGVSVMIEPLANIAHEVRIDKSQLVASNIIIIRTYNAGVLADGILTDTAVHFNFYTSFK